MLFRRCTLSCCMIMYAFASQGQSKDTPPRPAKVVIVEAAEDTLRRQYSAIVEPSQQAVLSFRVSGRVIELPVRASDFVTDGDVIARLDPRDFEAQITQLTSQLDQANAELSALRTGARDEEIAAFQADVDAAQAQADQAREAAQRSEGLAERGVVAEARVEQDRAAQRVAEAQLQAALQQLSIGRSGGRAEDIEAAEAAIRGLETQIKTARDNLEDATLRAPFDGIIARREVENFTNIQAGQDVVLLQRLSVVNLVFDVPGPDVLSFAGTGNVDTHVSFTALPDELLHAELVEFSTQADSATQTYRGRVAVTLPEGANILPGMVGNVIATATNDQVMVTKIPLSAVDADADGAPFVWVVDTASGAVAKTPVTLGDVQGSDVQVSAGVEAGDTVVSAGVTRLQDGMVIRPINEVEG
ncbi:efflux RND transporter periplasmic adaptor subunit [Litoreibacter roseus]|uniref:Uncharacterized protein n=1 Tax=Litoreibacter roseus TaxID=2601869 RepID=A0A6N6JN15_9RHOB|nr:efflux RND transporter periplasmic adaptor subunit [Litoreibacter roseus]GFE66748.1 hypothetical protein KIN_38220 [Litoreibacter roseus]